MNNKTNRLLAMLLTVVMCFATLAPTMVFAEDTTERKIIALENFDDQVINTGADATSVVNAGGFWFAAAEKGSVYTLEDNTLKYTDRVMSDFTDIRFYNDGMEEKQAMLQGDFTLSFRIKPLMPSIDMWINWTQAEQDNASGNVVWENDVRIRWGKLTAPGYETGDIEKCELPVGKWSVIEIAFDYDENATAYAYPGQTAETGATTSYTVRLNGYTVAKDVTPGYAFHTIDFFRLFQGSIGNYELDDLTIVTGLDEYSTNYDPVEEKVFFFDENTALTDRAYSFAVVGDTQIVNYYDNENGSNMAKIYDWIVENKDTKNIQYVMGMGDITEKSSDVEWARGWNAISKLNENIPYSVVRGNHDGSNKLNEYFNNDTYTSQFEGFYSEDKIENSYRTLTVGETKYLFITLDYGPETAVLEWAGNLCEQYSDHRVVITTHAYLYNDGTTIDSGDSTAPSVNDKRENDGDDIWEKLGKKYENIFLILSGHESCDEVITTQAIGDNGNTVTQMLIDLQGVDAYFGSTGMVTMLYFSSDGKTMEVETYSTLKEKYFLKENQYTVDISHYDSTISYNDFSSGVNTDFGKVSENGGLAFQVKADSTYNVENGYLSTVMGSADSHIQLQLYNAGYANTGDTPINRDFLLSFKLKMNADNQAPGTVYVRDNVEDIDGDKVVGLITFRENGLFVGGVKYASFETNVWSNVEMIFNYDDTASRFSSYTVLVDSKEIATFALSSTAATLSYINHFYLFRWRTADASFSVDDISVRFGIGGRGSDVGKSLYDVDFTESEFKDTQPLGTTVNGVRVLNSGKYDAVKSGVKNDILNMVCGTGHTFIDAHFGMGEFSKQDLTVSMQMKPIGNLGNDFFAINGATTVINGEGSKLKINGSEKELSLYRFSTVEVMIHYDYAKMAYTSIDLYVNGDHVGTKSLTGFASISYFRLFQTYTAGCGAALDSISVTTGCQSLYKGETSVTEFIGYQTTEADTNNNYNVRLLAIMTDANVEKYKNVGFKVSVSFATNGVTVDLPEETGVCTSVYESVLASAGIETTYTAATLGGKAIFALNCLDLSTDYGDATFKVTTYYTLADAEDAVEERTFEFTVTSDDLPKGGVN